MSVIDSFKLSNKIALITGGAGLLGVQHAQAVAEAGGLPILVDINEEKLREASQTLSNFKHEIYCCDVTDKSKLEELLLMIDSKFNQLDILINNAALNPKIENERQYEFSRLENYSFDLYQKEISVGLTAAFFCTQVFGTYMSSHRGGVILNIASDLGLIAPNQNLYKIDDISDELQPVKPVTYSIIKHALIGLTRYTATYWADKGVRCNALAPGGVENDQNKDFINKVQNLIPMGRMAHKDEYKASVVFLISDASSYMTGSIISIDGGRTCW